MASRPIKKGASLYNRILHEVTLVNRALPENRRLSLAERRKIVSEKLYPTYKDKKVREIRIRDIKKDIDKVYAKVPARKDCDVNFLNPAIYALIDWFALDEFITDILPNCIYIKVNAGELGQTHIFNTRNYGYHGSGVRQIIENIRPEVEDSSGAFWSGYKKLRPRKRNDGTPENYYLEFILHVDDQVLADTTEVKYTPKRTKRNIQRERTIRQVINERTRNLKNKKNRRKALRKKIPTIIKELQKLQNSIRKSKQKKKGNKQKFATKLTQAVRSVERAYNKGDITENQFQKFLQQLTKMKAPR